jgi:hypothetical protein
MGKLKLPSYCVPTDDDSPELAYLKGICTGFVLRLRKLEADLFERDMIISNLKVANARISFSQEDHESREEEIPEFARGQAGGQVHEGTP